MIVVVTVHAQRLVWAVRSEIASGTIRTWTYDADGDLTHVAPQWAQRAWMRPTIVASAVHFNILPPQGRVITRATYGFYHAHLVETLLTHFDSEFMTITATALPDGADIVG